MNTTKICYIPRFPKEWESKILREYHRLKLENLSASEKEIRSKVPVSLATIKKYQKLFPELQEQFEQQYVRDVAGYYQNRTKSSRLKTEIVKELIDRKTLTVSNACELVNSRIPFYHRHKPIDFLN